jgi:hypothetical protein
MIAVRNGRRIQRLAAASRRMIRTPRTRRNISPVASVCAAGAVITLLGTGLGVRSTERRAGEGESEARHHGELRASPAGGRSGTRHA